MFKVFLILLALIFSGMSYADHNSHLRGHNPDRGYTEANCKTLKSKTTKLDSLWMGHKVGCLIPELDGYTLIREYDIVPLDTSTGVDLMIARRKFGDKLEFSIALPDLTKKYEVEI